VRILIFHGYLLSGTGSNVYNARLAEALVRLGHDVHLLCQERHPERQSFVEAMGDWDAGKLEIESLESVPEGGPHCTVYRPDIGGLLPLYVQDRYEGTEAKTFAECTDAEIAAYVQANVEAVREVTERVCPDIALANHIVMGPMILARALTDETPYAVKIHGSALEYTVKPEPERFLGFAREGLAKAQAVLVGSKHTAESLWEALGGTEEEAQVKRRTRLGPPGVDVERFAPRSPEDVEVAVRGLLDKLRRAAPASVAEQASAFARDDRVVAEALERILDGKGVLVAYVGKLIVSKGVDLLIAAWPLVLRSVPDARLAIVGFGAYRKGLECLVACLVAGDLEGAKRIARAGRSLEAQHGGDMPAGEVVPLRYLLAFLDSLSGKPAEAERDPQVGAPAGAPSASVVADAAETETDADAYLASARRLGERIVLTGRLEHEELADVLPACEALVVPSTFPEAFGTVAAEGAACGLLPVSAAHSGLAEVSEILAEELPSAARAWLSFPVDDRAVRAIAERVVAWLEAERGLKMRTREALVSVVRERWSWEGVARGVIAAARGEPVLRPFG
jgi:glycosyltransferase involved in cell wall biosynthesis